MYSILPSSLLIAAAALHARSAADVRAAFVTTLGRDTEAFESFTRTASRVEGDIMARIPGTVLCHYLLELGSDGAVTRSTFDMKPLGATSLRSRHVIVERTADSVFADVDSAGHREKARRAVAKGAFPLFVAGFGDSYGLYSSLGVYEALISHLVTGSDTAAVPSVNMATGHTVPRVFLRPSPTLVDADFFKIAWTHLTLNATGQILSADGSQTAEKVQSHRVDYFDVAQAAKPFVALDKAGKGLGMASPNVIAKGSVGGEAVIVSDGSPRRRNRAILGTLIPLDTVWRTGANTVAKVDTPQENFAIAISNEEIAFSWDTFVWTVPIALKQS